MLANCPNFTRIECSNNKLTKLIIDNCSEISVLSVNNNKLTDCDFLTNLNPEKLTVLYITNNNFPPQDIEIFSKFINLKYFYLANNNFYGNIQSLQNLTKLEKLGISDNKIIGDLEYLPNSLSEISSITSQELKKNADSFKIV
jgi:Leucine-rich repeat (LRR) protein